MADIGIVMLDNHIPRPQGDVGNPASFGFPVAMAVTARAGTRRLPPYSAAVKKATGLPVWDALTLIGWLRGGVAGC